MLDSGATDILKRTPLPSSLGEAGWRRRSAEVVERGQGRNLLREHKVERVQFVAKEPYRHRGRKNVLQNEEKH